MQQQPYGAVSRSNKERVFLVGGGPSLRGFDFDCLREHFTVAINDACLRLPWADVAFTADARWIENRRDALERFAGRKYLAVPDGAPRPASSAVYLRLTKEAGFSTDPEVLHLGGTSGYAALNLAYLMGACGIVLLGYDYGAGHWHDGYVWSPEAKDRAERLAEWAREFRHATAVLERDGVRVVNLSPSSAITEFQKLSHEEYFR